MSRISCRSPSGTPATGSSSSSTRGRQASAMRDLEQAALAVGQLGDAPVLDVFETELMQQRVARRPDRAGRRRAAATSRRRCRAALATVSASDCNGVSPPKSWLIWNVRTTPRRTRAVRRQAGDVVAIEPDRAGARLQRAGEQVDQGRLAGAVRADQRVAGAELDLERDLVGGNDAAEALDEAARLEHGRSLRSSPPPTTTAAAAGRGRRSPARPGTGRSRRSSTAASRPRAGRAAA